MNTKSIPQQNTRWVKPAIIGSVLVVGIAAVLVLRPAQPIAIDKSAAQPLTVAEGDAGKVGELAIASEALTLANITLQPAESRLVSEKLAVSGSVLAGGDQMVKVTPRVTGKVIRLLAQSGDTVRAGQQLAILESTELGQAQALYRQALAKASAADKNLARQKQLANLGQFGKPQVEEARAKSLEAESAINQAEKELSEARSKLAEAESESQSLKSKVEQSEAELDVAKSRLNRAEALLKEELISRQEFERIQADHHKAAADVNVAKAELTQGETRITAAKASIQSAVSELNFVKQKAEILRESLGREEKIYKGQFLTNREIVDAEAELTLAQVEVRGTADGVRLLGGTPGGGNALSLTAPISGRVQERIATLGETIDSEHAAFTIVNLDQVWAELAIAPRDLSSVRVGDIVQLTSEAAPGKVFMGTILNVGSQADESTRAVSVRTALGNASHILKPGAFVRGTVVTDVRRERVTVPIAAIQEHTSKPTVYVALGAPGAFEVRHVKLGVNGDGWREISEGLKAGEQIAASGTFYLKSEALKSSLSDGCCAPGG